MSPVELAAQVETVECLNCDGQGAIAKRHFGRHVVDEFTETVCTCCNGAGTVDPDWISQCTSCSARYWTGDGCAHGNGLCEGCQPECRDCRSHT